MTQAKLLKKFLIFLDWLHNKEVFLAFCQNVENSGAREVLLSVSLRSSFWHQQLVTDSWCEIKCQLVFGAHKSLHAMAKGNISHYIGQTKPVDHPALWIRVEVNHIHRMTLRLKAAVFIVLKKLLQSEFIFIFLNCREADINFDLPGNSFVTQRKDVKLSTGGVAIPGNLLVQWRTTTGFEGLPMQNLDLISSTFSTSKSFVAGSAVANTCCWNSTEPTLTPFGGSELKFVE